MNRGRITNEVRPVSKKTFLPILKSCQQLVDGSSIVVNGNKINGDISNLHKLVYAYSVNKSQKMACRIIADSILMAEKSLPIS